MIVKEYIKDFEKLGFGMFVHYGLYSHLKKGEWYKFCAEMPDDEYFALANEFAPKKDWARELVAVAKNAGCRYITLTTRHHEGFSLFDTCGLNTFDAPHAPKCGRDLVREFVDACREADIIPFFYHTLLDWHEKTYYTDFPTYLVYLRKSVEILCKNYGKIGGLWFDGMWDKPDADWEEDAMYSMIRQYQPDAMIINNTGLDARGALGHIELDSVTFERGRPQPINMAESPKYIASEMCETIFDHWGYAENDLFAKSVPDLLESLTVCRRFGSNLLLNVGPMPDGSVRGYDRDVLEMLGRWTTIFGEAIHLPSAPHIAVINKEKDFVLQNGNTYYLFCHDLPMIANSHVALSRAAEFYDSFALPAKVKSVAWLDNGKELTFEQNGDAVTVHTEHFTYGCNYVVRVAKILAE